MSAYKQSSNVPVKATEATNTTEANTIIPNPIGGPPDSVQSESNILRKNSSLEIKVYPCVPDFESGISLFILKEAWEDYEKLLKEVGFKADTSAASDRAITLYAQAESFPTDSFQNDYGDSFLNQITDIGAGAFGQLAQIFGKKSATEAIGAMGKGAAEVGKDVGGIPGAALGMVGDAMTSGATLLQNMKESLSKSKSNIGKTVAQAADRLLAGARVDFPMIWKNSSYSPTFSCNIRLCNPDVKSSEATNKYILGPLAAILSMALPTADNKDLGYLWPLFCKVVCKGVFEIPAGAITNVTVMKGGDQGIVGYNQRLGIVDVRIDFVNLHNVMTVGNPSTIVGLRPTLKGYLDNLNTSKPLEPVKTTESPSNFGSSFVPDLESEPVSRMDADITAISDQLSSLSNFYS